MEEYEQIESELKIVYQEYITKMRNLHYLESTLEKYRESERYQNKQHQRALKRMQKRMKDEELRVLRGDSDAESMMSDSFGRGMNCRYYIYIRYGTDI